MKALKRIAPLRFLLFVALLRGGARRASRGVARPTDWRDGAATAFDVAALVFLLSLADLTRYADAATMRAHAAENDANRVLVLVLTTLVAFTVLAAIGGELPGARDGEPFAVAKLVSHAGADLGLRQRGLRAALRARLLPAAQSAVGDAGGIAFPGTTTPGYSDFAYFAFTLGMTFQTSDVAITATRNPPHRAAAQLRRVRVQHRGDRLRDQRDRRRCGLQPGEDGARARNGPYSAASRNRSSIDAILASQLFSSGSTFSANRCMFLRASSCGMPP